MNKWCQLFKAQVLNLKCYVHQPSDTKNKHHLLRYGSNKLTFLIHILTSIMKILQHIKNENFIKNFKSSTITDFSVSINVGVQIKRCHTSF